MGRCILCCRHQRRNVSGQRLGDAAAYVTEGVATQLALLASSIKFCDRFRDEKNPVLPVLQAGCWGLILQVSVAYRGQPAVVQALTDLYSKIM